jgi:RNA polymerase sigma-70 factor (ECF subfamily)
MQPGPDEFIPTRKSLLSRLKDWDDQESWREFFHIYRRLIRDTALKSGLTEQEAEDVVQETLISVAKTIKEFKYDRKRCTFKSWLRGLTQRRIADCFRKRPRERGFPAEEGSETALIERVPDPESFNLDAVWEEEWRKRLYDAAIERVKASADAEQYQMFDFYVVKAMPAGTVARTFGTSVGQVYLARHRISKLIKKEVRLLESSMR